MFDGAEPVAGRRAGTRRISSTRPSVSLCDGRDLELVMSFQTQVFHYGYRLTNYFSVHTRTVSYPLICGHMPLTRCTRTASPPPPAAHSAASWRRDLSLPTPECGFRHTAHRAATACSMQHWLPVARVGDGPQYRCLRTSTSRSGQTRESRGGGRSSRSRSRAGRGGACASPGCSGSSASNRTFERFR